MNKLKLLALLFLTAIFNSCEEESITDPSSNNDAKLLEQIQKSDGNESIVTEIFHHKLFDNKLNNKILKKDENDIVMFYNSKKEFNLDQCYTGKARVNFEEAQVSSGNIIAFAGPLDENTNQIGFSPGDIPNGIQFTGDGVNSTLAVRNFDYLNGQSKRLSVNFAQEDLTIRFNGEKAIHNVSFRLYISSGETYIDVKIYGENGLIGEKSILATFEKGGFVGIKSTEDIKSISMAGPDKINDLFVWERIDKVTFSSCDMDEDGIVDDLDNCPEISNPNQEDLDEDGIGDVCDNDRDNDSINNDLDNCPDIANNEQKDIDNDGVGDICDEDIDGDNIPNEQDNCPTNFNPNQSDYDYDRIGDACDPDDDNDGITDDKDKVQFSDVRSYIQFDEQWVGFRNQEVKRGMYMQDEINRVIDEVNALVDVSDAFRTRVFRSKMYRIVNNWWFKYKLLDFSEKEALLRYVNMATYPFNHNTPT